MKLPLGSLSKSQRSLKPISRFISVTKKPVKKLRDAITPLFLPQSSYVNIPETSLTLLEKAKLNESSAWERLVDLYAPYIYGRCRFRWNLNASDAENVGQEVFVAVARKLPDFDRKREGSFRKWIQIIADNKCRDFFRQNDGTVVVGGSEAKGILDNMSDDSGEEPSHSGAGLIENEDAWIMHQAMKSVQNEFSDRDWQIFVSVAIEDKDRQSVATEHGVTDNVVYLALSRIRKRIKHVVEDLSDEDLFERLTPEG